MRLRHGLFSLCFFLHDRLDVFEAWDAFDIVLKSTARDVLDRLPFIALRKEPVERRNLASQFVGEEVHPSFTGFDGRGGELTILEQHCIGMAFAFGVISLAHL